MPNSQPQIVQRAAQPYIAIKIETPMSGMGGAARKAMQKLDKWMPKNNVTPTGALFWRYTVINMEGTMQLEIGFPVERVVDGDETVISGVLPAGEYVSMIHTGSWRGKQLYFATRDLLAWGAENNIEWDRADVPEGDAWVSRLEIYHTDPALEPDINKYETELAFKVK